MSPNIFKGELMRTFKHNKNLGDYFVSVKFKLDPSVGVRHTSCPKGAFQKHLWDFKSKSS